MTHHEDYATLRALITGVDQAARTAEAKWGVDRLPAIVTTDTRIKFERQRAKWRFALETAYEADVITRDMLDLAVSTTGGMERAWVALDAEATASGAQPVSPDIWELRLAGGKIAALVRTVAEAAVAMTDERYATAYTLDEVARLIAIADSAVRTTVATNGPPTNGLPPDRTWVKHGEEIPF